MQPELCGSMEAFRGVRVGVDRKIGSQPGRTDACSKCGCTIDLNGYGTGHICLEFNQRAYEKTKAMTSKEHKAVRRWWNNWMNMSETESEAKEWIPKAEHMDIRCYVEASYAEGLEKQVEELKAESAKRFRDVRNDLREDNEKLRTELSQRDKAIGLAREAFRPFAQKALARGDIKPNETVWNFGFTGQEFCMAREALTQLDELTKAEK